jgi:outer membrane protein assembly factor BamB
VRPGILRAFNAQNVTNELWNSELVSARDSVGNFAKFCPPTVANGKVYLATFSGRLDVYGLLPLPSLVIGLSDTSVTLSWQTNGFSGYTVQAATNLSSPVWQNLTNSVMVTNGTFEVAVPPSGDTVFYRLKR